MDVPAVRRERRVVAERAQEIFREGRRDRAEGRGADDRQLGPAEEERGEATPRPTNEIENAAGVRVGSGDFGERQRTAQRENAAGDPHREHRYRPGQPVRDSGGSAEDAGADGGPDDDGDRGPEAELARQAGTLWE